MDKKTTSKETVQTNQPFGDNRQNDVVTQLVGAAEKQTINSATVFTGTKDNQEVAVEDFTTEVEGLTTETTVQDDRSQPSTICKEWMSTKTIRIKAKPGKSLKIKLAVTATNNTNEI